MPSDINYLRITVHLHITPVSLSFPFSVQFVGIFLTWTLYDFSNGLFKGNL